MLQKRIETLVKLSQSMTLENEAFGAAVMLAEKQNPWFTKEFIEMSTSNIRSSFLDKKKLEAFANQYEEASDKKNVGLVLAGNIPLVGFHDVLCGVLSGHFLQIKLSSKDKMLMTYVINVLKENNEELNEKIIIADSLPKCDAYIATGSNQSNVYFEQYFGKYPNILRKSRSSVVILTGDETGEELKELGKDVHYYFGLGCRNVSKIYVPKDYDFEKLIVAFKDFEHLENMHKYKNNLDYNLSLLLLNQQPFMSTKALLVIEKENTHAPIAVLHFEYYDNIQAVETEVKKNVEVQAIVGSNHIPFGQAQSPSLKDFADGVDTMAFLSNL